VLDMISANHKEWSKLNSKRMQVHQLAHQQQRVVAAALGCDTTAAAATLAALSAGQPVQHLLDGFVSVSVRQSTPGVDAVAALAEDGTGPLEDSAAAEALIKDAKGLVTELTFWEDGPAMLAWLLLRSGQLETAASIAEAAPNGFFAKQPQHSNHQWGWRWWVLAQVKWRQGDLSAVKLLLQQGQQQLPQQLQGEASGVGNSLWRLLVPQGEELGELLVQVQQLLSLKEAGNAAIQAKQYDKAVEAYGKALGMQPSCGFAAVIHSNRAAALQQQQRLVEALADCSRAVALDPKYARAYLRCEGRGGALGGGLHFVVCLGHSHVPVLVAEAGRGKAAALTSD
jgi:tetratricopeptide (TPR) repeat protein